DEEPEEEEPRTPKPPRKGPKSTRKPKKTSFAGNPDSSDSSDSDSSESDSEFEDNRRSREKTPFQEEWEKVTGLPSGQTIKRKGKTHLQKIREPEACTGTGKFKNPETFDGWVNRVQLWIEWQGLDIQKRRALKILVFVL